MSDTFQQESDPSSALQSLQALVRIISQALDGDGGTLTLPQLRALVLIAELGPQRSVDLASALSIDPSTASRLCARLEEKELVSVQRSRRSKRELAIDLTPVGRNLLDSITENCSSDIRFSGTASEPVMLRLPESGSRLHA